MSAICIGSPGATGLSWRRAMIPPNALECAALETRVAKRKKSAATVRKEMVTRFIQPLMTKTSRADMSRFLDKSAQPFTHLFIAYCEILRSNGMTPREEQWNDVVTRLFTGPSDSFSDEDLFRMQRVAETLQQMAAIAGPNPPDEAEPADGVLFVHTALKLNLLLVGYMAARSGEVRVAHKAGSVIAGLADQLGQTLLAVSSRIGLLDDESGATPVEHDEETRRLTEAGIAEYAAVLDSD